MVNKMDLEKRLQIEIANIALETEEYLFENNEEYLIPTINNAFNNNRNIDNRKKQLESNRTIYEHFTGQSYKPKSLTNKEYKILIEGESYGIR